MHQAGDDQISNNIPKNNLWAGEKINCYSNYFSNFNCVENTNSDSGSLFETISYWKLKNIDIYKHEQQ